MTDQFHWGLEGLDEARFAALANLLSLRNAGQLELPTVYDVAADADADVDIEHISVCDTNKFDELAESCTPEQLKMQFLDRLAEVMSTKKGGTHVACATMTEKDDSATIFVARNGSFSPDDTQCFRTFERCLSVKLGSTIGFDKMGNINHDDLWNALLVHYDARLKEIYIPNLKRCFDDCTDLFPTELSTIPDLDSLYNLRSLCLRRSPGLSLAEQRRLLVLEAYTVRESVELRKNLLGTAGLDSIHTKLWNAICYLARLRMAYYTFVKARAELTTFGTISIVPISPPKAKKAPTPLSFSKTLRLVGLIPDDNTVRRYIHNDSTVSKAEKEFTTAQQRGPHVHAEVQVVLYLMQTDRLKDIHYIGCSKRSCYLCWQFLQDLPTKISTRGCHGKLYSRWTIPKINTLPSGLGRVIADALQAVQVRMEALLKSPITAHYNRVPDSSIGSIRNAAKSGHHQFTQDTPLQSTLEGQPTTENECCICEELTSRKCSLCGTDWFCSDYCQTQRTYHHKFKCTGSEITTADYLYLDIGKDQLPESEDVCDDFGFSSLHSFLDRQRLFGLYKGLYLDDVSSDQLHKWQSENSLEANIISFYTAIPENCRGGYFPWFLENKHRIHLNGPKLEFDLEEYLQEARTHLDPEDRNKDMNALQPTAKRDCFKFYSSILHQCHPPPKTELYFDFGFCTCAGKHNESRLGVLYTTLIVGERFLAEAYPWHTFPKKKHCTFKEFWKAYEDGTMTTLMATGKKI
ncbi:hypothetical protein K440DRAFT_679735 [Wilcoxina mikolae CBS 423.85]|nr:hypothetical protein K440DRAFT_679735 [Wilcoxina mikolae CBS 423.85]